MPYTQSSALPCCARSVAWTLLGFALPCIPPCPLLWSALCPALLPKQSVELLSGPAPPFTWLRPTPCPAMPLSCPVLCQVCSCPLSSLAGLQVLSGPAFSFTCLLPALCPANALAKPYTQPSALPCCAMRVTLKLGRVQLNP